MRAERAVHPISLALCADDYGQHEDIDQAVCTLLDLGRLSAVSCMSTAPRWNSDAAPALRAALDRCAADPTRDAVPFETMLTPNQLAQRRAGRPDLGLHLNLTEGFGAGAPRLPEVLLRSYLHLLDRRALAAQFERQFDAFEDALGRRPDFIDGHQHIHQLPQVREVVLALIARRYGEAGGAGTRPWVRNTEALNPAWRGKPRLLARLGGATLGARLRAAATPTNYGFAGVYGFDDSDYPTLFASWLDCANDACLIMCHPGARSREDDPIGPARVREYAFFCSEQFPAMLAAYHIRLDPLSASLPHIAHALAQLPAAVREPRFLRVPRP